MKDKLPSYQFKVGEECWCIWHGFTKVKRVSRWVSFECICEYNISTEVRRSVLTLPEAKLLGLEPPRKMKTVTMWQALLLGEHRYFISEELFENESEAKDYYVAKFIKLVNPIEVEVEE